VSDQLLTRAAQGNDEAFRELTEPHRRELQFHCYRILGSMHDADDALQETMLRAWRGLRRVEARASLRSWLYQIATNCCLDALRDEGRRPPPAREPMFEAPAPTRLAEPTSLEPYPDALLEGIVDTAPGPEARYETRETIELAFIAALQALPPRQRATLLLRDVLGFRAAEVAQMLNESEDSVKSALKRARGALERKLPAAGAEQPPPPRSAREREIVQRFTEAWEADDVDGIIALLTDGAWLRMPPLRVEYQGPDAVGSFLHALVAWRSDERFRLVPTRANTQPAFGVYRAEPDAAAADPTGLMVVTLEDARIAAMTSFLDPSILARFGLPLTLRK
jgi:RNA polymerase sigma-70 factor (TIGR02960 family)